jgi:hypothetical protein
MNGTSFHHASRAPRGTPAVHGQPPRHPRPRSCSVGSPGPAGLGKGSASRPPCARAHWLTSWGRGLLPADAALHRFTSGSLRQIKLIVKKAAGDYSVELLGVVSDAPSHSPLDVLAATTVPNASVPNGN